MRGMWLSIRATTGRAHNAWPLGGKRGAPSQFRVACYAFGDTFRLQAHQKVRTVEALRLPYWEQCELSSAPAAAPTPRGTMTETSAARR